MAAKNAAILHLALGHLDKGIEYARLAATLQPKADDAWDLLDHALCKKGCAEAAEISARRLRANPTARNHYLLAEEQFSKKNFIEAEKELRAGLKLDPGHVYCQMGLAAVLLRKSTHKDNLAEAQTHLKAAADTLRRKEPSEPLLLDLGVLQALCHALSGEYAHSRFGFYYVLEHDAENTVALMALKILCTSPSE
jgi:tetratricopeptide (TPR) repeat protein